MKLQDILEVNLTPKARAMWATLGTEYTKSFLALKELIENSISASDGKQCKIAITLEELSGDVYNVSFEDNSGGVQDPSVLLTVATESLTKEGKYNYYGYGLKNALAYFQPDWAMSNWSIQSKTHESISEDKFLEVRAPYVYNGEFNDTYQHNGMHIVNSDINGFKGKFNEPGTYIEFQTQKSRFNNLHPIKKGRPIESVNKAAEELSNLISFYYRPLLMENKLNVEIRYCHGDGKRNFKTISVKPFDLPISEKLHSFEKKQKVPKGGSMTIKSTWFLIDRDVNSVYEFPQERGMLLYTNGVLVEPYRWENNVFGGNTFHPSMNSLVCVVEVWGEKEFTPELSVSKTKIIENGDNYQVLVNTLYNECPTNEIDYVKNAANTVNEIVKRDRRFETYHREMSRSGFICDLQKERLLIQPNGKKGNESLRVDIFYKVPNLNKIVIEEFKKEKINSSSIAQVLLYQHLLKLEFPNHEIEIVLISGECQETAKVIIDSLNNNGFKISFKSFTELGIS
jgi:hypothetical protein